MAIVSPFFDVIIDVALLLLIFYPLLTLINKWLMKKENKDSEKVEELVDVRK